MDNQSNLLPHISGDTHSLDGVPHLQEDWRLARAARVNLLLIHAAGVPRTVLQSLVQDPDEPIASWCPGERLVLPPAARAGTVILHDVGALAHDDQRRLLEWLEGARGRAQVVSTTPATLLPHVHAGKFIDRLYYRLNTVCVDMTA
jgi:transcriptional regulator of aromatic amino acid metabolism